MTSPYNPWSNYNQIGERGFDDSPLMVGYIRGARAFHVTDDGVLTGVTYRAPWVDGENTARCLQNAPWVEHSRGTITDPDQYPNLNDRHPDTGRWVHPMQGCTCGLWSYWAGVPNTYWTGDTRVYGVIQGYGQTRRGTRGARTAKARILGLHIPPGNSTMAGVLRDLIVSNYPSVDVYPSVEELLAVHPPTRDVTYSATTQGFEHT